MVCGLIVAGAIHGVKSLVVRPAVTVTTAGTGHPVVSTVEDISATILSVLSIVIPIILGVILFILAIGFIWWLIKRSQRIEQTP